MGYNSIDPFVQLAELGATAGTSILERKGGSVQVSNDGGATFGAIGGGLSATQIVTQPNSNSVQVNALELDTTLSTNTAGSEVSRLVIKLLRAGTAANYYQFDPDTFTLSSPNGVKIALGASTIQTDVSLANLNLSANGDVVIGAAGALATSAALGFLQVPTCAGAPTGTLSRLTTGKVAMVYDTTNNKLWTSAGGGTWKGVVLA